MKFRISLAILFSTLMILFTELMSVEPIYAPVVHADVIHEQTDLQRAVFQVSKVFGRGGCGDYGLAVQVAKISLKNQVPPELEASVITVESSCNPLAISNKGAIGLGQILVSCWHRDVDFSKVNLFNPEENLNQSTRILHDLVKQYGTRNALLRYSGGDPAYTDKVINLAGIK